MILFVDDEPRRVESYVEELIFAGYDVKHVSGADLALDYLDGGGEAPQLVVLDIMMPRGKRFEGVDTENGLRTGIRVYERVRKLYPKLPIAFLSNVSEDDAGLRPDPASHYFSKRRYLPNEFAEEVRRIMEEHASDR